MKLNVVAVHDAAVNAFTQSLALVPHTGAAVREFTTACNDSNHEFCKNSKDYDLFCLAIFDNESGKFENFETPQRLIRGSDAKRSE